ncbi:hypothetical protein C9E94_23615 [Salmonella enterica subsp. enterica serovar Kibusi]|nr:hypothetical protein [Salmonella enterica]EBR0238955.1 hypothetical protein [Salmonella enterica subsp. enterica serovar Telelkebir]EBS0651364.1 hypothetical protein [Salmonella enterica subsp. enterica serovar Yolo]EBU9918347.1 hypothetical protein [Salmonella enterica subsp. enterica serovar Weybridge]ECK9500806.1 hypothetical protein [Salmonella enterica subsp. enterica serovar Infantis str. CFSAN000522]EDF9811586.1 hypothetical protein [Salmonella enterica subsp. enterica serovar Tennes
MKDNNGSSQHSDVWTTIFNGLAEAIKIFFSIILAVLGSKAVTSPKEEKLHAGYRNGHSGYGYYDGNNQRIYSDDDN